MLPIRMSIDEIHVTLGIKSKRPKDNRTGDKSIATEIVMLRLVFLPHMRPNSRSESGFVGSRPTWVPILSDRDSLREALSLTNARSNE